ncbi:hypothetical protein [Vibrio sp. 10N.261.55.A7]|uniref:hypothetical protein n=1 Tax=Vibrio sp. 10N.261.55.A7 TaxID=1880851 RepID=UPI0012FFEE80|nr:hypothetical protein [Vibrio sp. 10N.261.55.A7]
MKRNISTNKVNATRGKLEEVEEVKELTDGFINKKPLTHAKGLGILRAINA